MYNFDEIIDRRGSGCLNVDHLKKVFGRDDLLSFWIADMDFKTPDFIIDALKARLDHPILGYP
ncbi:MAG: cystathionine beta-lyase, partial [Bacteroidales bacterium]|nr:cystathionine beta-lyase [Bacteroidales bacterium]